MLWPREAGKYIFENAKHVFVNAEGISKAASKIVEDAKAGKLGLEEFKQNEVLPLDKNLTTEDLANWVFLVDTLNFNFWTKKGDPKYAVTYNGKRRSGYMGMVGAVNRAIDEGLKIYEPSFYSRLQISDIEKIFRSDTESTMPLLEERVKVLSQVGKILIEKYSGSFINVLKAAEGSALKLMEIVTTNFPCFNDVAKYMDQDIAIFKRVQILAADIWMLYRGEGLGDFKDIDKLTMFADYRVPQSLVYFGAMSYSDELLSVLNNEELIQNGHPYEVEIRGCSIHATELLVTEINKKFKNEKLPLNVNAIKVDYWLWDYRIENASLLESIPYHKTRCIFY